MLDVMKSLPTALKAWLAVTLLALLLISCSSSTPPTAGGGGGEDPPDSLYAGADRCYLCHADGSIARFDGMQIFSRWLDGPHGNYESDPSLPPEEEDQYNNTGIPDFDELIDTPGCSLDCHDQLGDGELLEDFWIDTGIPSLGKVNRPIVGCESCHGESAEHAGSSGLVPPEFSKSSLYPGPDLCDQCHDVDFDVSTLIVHDGLDTTDLYTVVITDTHEDDKATPDKIEGYVMDTVNNERACLDCHDVHSVDVTINEQWARSAHAGHILEIKEDAILGGGDIDEVKAAAVDGADNAFPHYDWDATTELDAGIVVNDRGSCQMCHTATGNKNFWLDPAGYDITGINNDFSHLADWEADNPATIPVGDTISSGQNELLYCWSCHADSSGTLHSSGPVTLKSYPVTLSDDVGNSNICLNCHGGRGNVDNIINDSRSSRAKAHHGAAAGTLFSKDTHIGYEYLGLSYANKPYFAHDGIATPGSGPCVACHMNDANHTFAVVEKDVNGVITGINADICVTCHDGEHVLFVSQAQGLLGVTVDIWNGVDEAVPTPVTEDMAIAAAADLEAEKLGFEAALGVLEDYVTNTISNYLNDNITTDDDDGNPDPPHDEDYSTVEEEAYGAFQNFKYLEDEPGAYAHNRYYAKRLIFDSIDFLQDGDVGDASIDLNGHAAAAAYLNSGDPVGAVTRP